MKPRTLLFDIETSPNIAYVWGKYEQDVIKFVKEGMIICVAWKWLDHDKIYSMALPKFYGYKPFTTKTVNSKLIVKLHETLSSADIIVAHNGDQFDIKYSNAEFLRNGLRPVRPSKTIDTKKVAKAIARFNSNKLDDLGNSLSVGRKMKTGGFDLWEGCMAGNRQSWAQMEAYNKQDVALLERVYLKLAPWMQNHPNVTAFMGAKDKIKGFEACNACGSQELKKQGYKIRINGKKQQLQCVGCGHWMLGRLEPNGNNLR